ncbi:hypothetical protein BBJ28_00010037 [Nothophytophthora sp. Chile5]|nr:hypothetical protein BBJ28_00010037 [Nothophytophthora sp. Chile5]
MVTAAAELDAIATVLVEPMPEADEIAVAATEKSLGNVTVTMLPIGSRTALTNDTVAGPSTPADTLSGATAADANVVLTIVTPWIAVRLLPDGAAHRLAVNLNGGAATDGERLLAAAPWTVPTALLAGWMVWPGLTENFKEETLGLKASVPTSKPVAAPAAPAKELFRGPGKYTFVRSEIGEAPTLEED